MSELRNHLDEARREHHAARYPGDLATDLLGVQPTRLGYANTPRRHWLFWTNIGALGAIAATVTIVLWRQPAATNLTATTDERPTVAVSQPQEEEEFTIVPRLAGATLTPQGASLVPSAETAGTFPAMPSFPSMTDVLNSASTTTDTNDNNQENT